MIRNFVKYLLGKHSDGVTGVGSSVEDFSFGSLKNLEELLSETKDGDDTIIQYNQNANRYTTMACTLYAPMTVVSSLFNVELTQKEIDHMRNYAKKEYGYKAMVGNDVKKGVECFCKRWNTNKAKENQQVIYFLTNLSQLESKKVRDKKHLLVCSYSGNAKYNEDKKDRNLQGTIFGAREYGHATTIGSIKEDDFIFDTNKGDHDSIYKIYPGNLPDLIKNGVFCDEAYAILPMQGLVAKPKSKLQLYLEKVRALNLTRKPGKTL